MFALVSEIDLALAVLTMITVARTAITFTEILTKKATSGSLTFPQTWSSKAIPLTWAFECGF